MPLEGFAQGSGVFRFVLEQAHSLAVWRKVRAEAGVGQWKGVRTPGSSQRGAVRQRQQHQRSWDVSRSNIFRAYEKPRSWDTVKRGDSEEDCVQRGRRPRSQSLEGWAEGFGFYFSHNRMPLEGFAQGSGVFRFVLEEAHSLAVWKKVRAEAGVGQWKGIRAPGRQPLHWTLLFLLNRF